MAPEGGLMADEQAQAETSLPSIPKTSMPSPRTVAQQVLTSLHSRLPGKVSASSQASGLQPDDHCWNTLLKAPGSPVLPTPSPLAYVYCTSTDDVVAAMQVAVHHGIKVQARGNGHHYGGAWLTDCGLVLDLSRMKAVHVDSAQRTASVQPGVTTAELREATIAHGLHFPGGHISSVGISGFILGGGNGWGVRHCGAAADNVLEFEVVTPASASAAASTVAPEAGRAKSACGGALRISSETDSELFWGLKGAGMFLGVVTEFVVQLHDVPDVLPCITAIYPIHLAAEVGELFKLVHDDSPKELEVSLCFTYIPRQTPSAETKQPTPAEARVDDSVGNTLAECGHHQQHAGMQAVVIIGCVGFVPGATASLDATRARLRAYEPNRRVLLSEEELPYLKALATLDASWDWPGLCLYGHGTFVEEQKFDVDLVKVMQHHCTQMSSSRSLLLVAPAGPCGRAPAAYGFRGSFYVAAYAMWPRTAAGPSVDNDDRHADWVRSFGSEAKPWVQGCYLNEVMLTEPGQALSCFEVAALPRLTRLKAEVDPNSLLREFA